MRRHLRPDQVAVELGCSRATIYRLIAAGELEAFRLTERGSLRIPASSLDQFISRRIVEFQVAELGLDSVSNGDK